MPYTEYTYEALRWLRQRTHPCALGPSHEGIDGWNTQKAIAFVQAFYAAGSPDVRVVNPMYDARMIS
jgi:hypothetical protein